MGYSPRGRKESDTTEQLTLSLFTIDSVSICWDLKALWRALLHLGANLNFYHLSAIYKE